MNPEVRSREKSLTTGKLPRIQLVRKDPPSRSSSTPKSRDQSRSTHTHKGGTFLTEGESHNLPLLQTAKTIENEASGVQAQSLTPTANSQKTNKRFNQITKHVMGIYNEIKRFYDAFNSLDEELRGYINFEGFKVYSQRIEFFWEPIDSIFLLLFLKRSFFSFEKKKIKIFCLNFFFNI